LNQSVWAETKGQYLLLGDVKEGWKVFTTKKCSLCHSIWGEGGKEGPDLSTLPKQCQPIPTRRFDVESLARDAGKDDGEEDPLKRIEKKEMADLFAFLYFIRYMDEPGDAEKGKRLLGTKGCTQCHAVKEETRGDLSYWGVYAILFCGPR